MDHRPAARLEREERQRRVMESVWRWKAPQHPSAAMPGRRLSGGALRDFAIGLGIAALLFASGRFVLAGVATAVSAVVLLVRAVVPPALSDPLVAVTGRVARQVGHALSAVVLGTVYFTVFSLLRAWRDLAGHDTLRLKRPVRGQSFWIDRSTLPETSPDKPY